jgi:hypothetical protein
VPANAAERRGGEQEAVAGVGELHRRRGPDRVEHQHGEDGAAGEVEAADHDREGAQQRAPAQEPETLGDVGPDRGRARVVSGEAAADQEQHPDRRDPEQHRCAEGEADPRRDEEAAERRADELVRGELGSVQPAVGARERGLAHQLREDGLRRRVVDRLGHADADRGGVEQPDRAGARHGGDGEEGEERRAGGVGDEHQPAPVVAVGEGAGEQGEHQPGQGEGEGEAGDEPGGVGVPDGDQRQRDLHHAVGEVGEGGRRPELPVARPQGFGRSRLGFRFHLASFAQ